MHLSKPIEFYSAKIKTECKFLKKKLFRFGEPTMGSTVTREYNYHKCIKQSHWREWRKRCWPKKLLEMNDLDSIRLKAKGHGLKHYTLVDKVFPVGVQVKDPGTGIHAY